MIVLEGKPVSIEIKLWSTIYTVISVIATLFTIYFAIINFKPTIVIIILLSLIIIILSVLIFKGYFLIKKYAKNYNDLLTRHNKAKDNQDSLEKMIEQKNNEIDQLYHSLSIQDAKSSLLFHILYQKEDKPNETTLKNALNIDSKGVINHD